MLFWPCFRTPCRRRGTPFVQRWRRNKCSSRGHRSSAMSRFKRDRRFGHIGRMVRILHSKSQRVLWLTRHHLRKGKFSHTLPLPRWEMTRAGSAGSQNTQGARANDRGMIGLEARAITKDTQGSKSSYCQQPPVFIRCRVRRSGVKEDGGGQTGRYRRSPRQDRRRRKRRAAI
jgi:hypothetical protein